MKTLIVAVLIAAMASGCALKMGNMETKLLDGWNQPTVQTEKTEKVTPPSDK